MEGRGKGTDGTALPHWTRVRLDGLGFWASGTLKRARQPPHPHTPEARKRHFLRGGEGQTEDEGWKRSQTKPSSVSSPNCPHPMWPAAQTTCPSGNAPRTLPPSRSPAQSAQLHHPPGLGPRVPPPRGPPWAPPESSCLPFCKLSNWGCSTMAPCIARHVLEDKTGTIHLYGFSPSPEPGRGQRRDSSEKVCRQETRRASIGGQRDGIAVR